MRITADVVRELCDLSKLDLSPDEAERMRHDLDQILDYVEQLSAIDTRDVEPTTNVLGLTSPLRADVVAGVLPGDEAVRNAPERSATAMVVPQVKDE